MKWSGSMLTDLGLLMPRPLNLHLGPTTDLDRDFWQEMWVAKSGGNVETEVATVLDNMVTNTYEFHVVLYKRLLEQHRLQDGIQLCLHILNEAWVAKLHAVLKWAQVIWVGEL